MTRSRLCRIGSPCSPCDTADVEPFPHERAARAFPKVRRQRRDDHEPSKSSSTAKPARPACKSAKSSPAFEGVELVSLPPRTRKNVEAKRELLGKVDVTILCLPDEAAKEAAALIDALGAGGPRVIDASSAHRVAPGWVYGFPELSRDQAKRIAAARKVTNPGCHATGAIAILRPLDRRRPLPKDFGVTIGSVSGYSGGGKSMIEAYERGRAPPFELYGLALEHKHVPGDRDLFRPDRGVRFSCLRSAISARACSSACRCISTRCHRSRARRTCGRRSRSTIAAAGAFSWRARPNSAAELRLEPEFAEWRQRHANPCLRQ